MSVIARSGLNYQFLTVATLLKTWESTTSLIEFYSLYPRLSFLLSEIENKVRERNCRFGTHFIPSLLLHVFCFLNPRTSFFGLRSVSKHWWNVLSSTAGRRTILEPGRLVQLGHAYRYGKRGVPNHKEALCLYQLAASQGDPDGEAWVAYSYIRHLGGVERNDEETFRLSILGVQKNHPQAYANLGMCYQTGNGVDRNVNEAIRLFRCGVDYGDSYSQIELGMCYLHGAGVEENDDEAARLFHLAAIQDNPIGQSLLGFCYADGTGVEKDLQKAVHWYRLAVEQGNPEGQYSLARVYATGEGVSYDLSEAVRLCNLAAEQGHERAKKLYKKLISGGGRSDSELESDSDEGDSVP